MMNWSLPSLVLPALRGALAALLPMIVMSGNWTSDILRLSIDCGGRCLKLREAPGQARFPCHESMDHARSKRERLLKARHLSARRHLRLTALITPDHSEAMNETGVSRYCYFQIIGLASFTLSAFPCRL